MNEHEKKKRRSLMISDAVWSKLESKAKQDHRTVSSLLRLIVEQYLNEVEEEEVKTIEKDNPMDIETFLFGGEYCRDHDPCKRTSVEGFNTFWAEYFQSSFKDFKDSVRHMIEEFGYDQKNDICMRISELDVDNNVDHHSYKMPSDKNLKKWHRDLCGRYGLTMKP